MQFEQIIKREDGSQVKIELNAKFSIDSLKITHKVSSKQKGKRKFIFPVDTNTYSYRQLQLSERIALTHKASLTLVTEEEIKQAREDFHASLKAMFMSESTNSTQ